MIPRILIAVFICLAAGFLSGLVTTNAIETWYVTLNKPSFNPPNWLLGPVWTVLYIVMGIAAGMVWNKGTENPEVRLALSAFIFQLGLNALWSIIFFGMKNPGLALAENALLWLSIGGCIYLFSRVSKPAAWLLLPYILWVSFAIVLNYFLWHLNR